MSVKIILRIFLLCLVFIQITGVAGALSLTEVGSYDTAGNALDVAVSGSYAYVADGDNGLVIIDINNPAAPVLAGSYDTAGNALDVAVSGSYAYVADGYNGLVVIDISNTAVPVLAGSYSTARFACGVAMSGSYAYVADGDNGLVIVDISNQTAPVLAGSYNTAGFAYDLAVSGSYAYIADSSGLVIVDISNPVAPAFAGSYNTAGSAYDVVVSGSYAYVADSINDLVIIDISNTAAPVLAGSYDTAGYAQSVAVSGSYAYVADLFSFVIIDINNPAVPVLVGSYDTAGNAQSVAVSGNYAYVADFYNGLVVLHIAKTGSISVSSNPSGASVYLDGSYKGTTPLTVSSVSAGTHTVKLTKTDYNDVSSTVTVNSGQTASVSKTLTEIVTTGSISISSNPNGAIVYLDSSYKGTTPLTVSSVSTGSHTVKLTKSGYNDVSSTVTVNSGLTTSVSKTLTEIVTTGSISVSSNPSGASVYLDGSYKGTAPMNLNSVSTGSHTVKLTKSGYNDVSSTVTVSSDQTASVSKTLSLLMGDIPVETAPIENIPVEAAPVEKGFLTNTTIVGAILTLLIFGMIIKKLKNSSKDTMLSKSLKSKETSTSNVASTLIPKENSPINIKSAFGYKGATIQYKIKIENPTPEPIGDINVNLYVPDVFLVSEITKTIVMLKPNEAKTVTFEIRPTGECGDCEVSGKVIFYDYSTKKTNEIDIPTKSLSIVCPMLKGKEISESEWHSIVSNLIETEESTREIDMPAETLFTMISRIVKDMHMHRLEPEITNSQQLFNGVARFYGEGVKGLKYAVQIEVIGGAKKSKLILKTWAEKEEALTGFYHGLLDEIEKRVQIKSYIDDAIVQNFYHYGDNIGTQMKDSFVQRSNIGAGEDVNKCPNCSRDADANEKFCLECGTKL